MTTESLAHRYFLRLRTLRQAQNRELQYIAVTHPSLRILELARSTHVTRFICTVDIELFCVYCVYTKYTVSQYAIR